MSTFVTLATWFTLRQGAQQEIKGASSKSRPLHIATCAKHPAQTCIFQSRKNLGEEHVVHMTRIVDIQRSSRERTREKM
jgi:hypothetical protein